MPSPSSMYPPAWEFPGGLDSVLNQTLPMQPSQRYYVHPMSNIPTVLPAAYQSQWGPTASASQEFYGPYWPDGTYNPYRPAAVRDNRFYNDRSGQLHYSTSPRAHMSSFPQLRKPGRLPNPSYDQHQYTSYTHTQYPPNVGNEWQIANAEKLHYHDKQPGLPRYEQPLARYASSSRIEQPAYPDGLSNPILPPLAPGSASDTIAFRDKSFTWANRIYAELVATIQRSSRESHHGPSSNGPHKSTTKPAIYPKPPKRSGSHFSDGFNASSKAIPYNQLAGQSNASLPQVDSDPARPSTAIFSPHRRASDFGQLARPKTFTAAAPPFPPPYPARTELRRTSDSTVYQSTAHQHGPGVRDAAYSALAHMELLCEEAQIPWIDGMLLAGCLAYGLESYEEGSALVSDNSGGRLSARGGHVQSSCYSVGSEPKKRGNGVLDCCCQTTSELFRSCGAFDWTALLWSASKRSRCID